MIVQFLDKITAVHGVVHADSWKSVGKLLLTLVVVSHWVSVPVPEPFSARVGVVSGAAVVLVKLDNWVDVLVEECWLNKVLLEGGHGPVALEVVAAHVPLEHWVAPVLAEEGKTHVFTEKGKSHNLVVLKNVHIRVLLIVGAGKVVVSIKIVDFVGVVPSVKVSQFVEGQALSGGYLQVPVVHGLVHVHGLAGNSRHQQGGNNLFGENETKLAFRIFSFAVGNI